MRKKAVLLVDNIRRDWLALSRITHHLEARGIATYLEPI